MKINILISLISLFCLEQAAWGRQLAMNDFTVLLPLPKNESEIELMIGPDDQNNSLGLIPKKYYGKLPNALLKAEASEYTYSNLRVVAIRFDPCFKEQDKCFPQIRLVWQPIGYAESYGMPMPRLGLEAKDAALHTFYVFSENEFKEIVENLFKLRNESLSLGNISEENWLKEPLQVHPIITKEGLSGKYISGLKTLIKEKCTIENMWRMTAMKTIPGGDIWTFFGFDLNKNEEPKKIIIPAIGGKTEQTFQVSLSAVEAKHFTGGSIKPSPEGENVITPLVTSSRSFENSMANAIDMAVAIKRLENPHVTNPSNVDCISCHLAQTAGSILFRMKPDLNSFQTMPSIVSANQYQSTWNLLSTGGKKDQPNVLRVLGYFEKTPIIARRVIHETAEIAECFSKNNCH